MDFKLHTLSLKVSTDHRGEREKIKVTISY